MQIDTPYLVIFAIIAIAVPLLVSFFIIKSAVASANRPIERHLRTLIKLQAHTMDRDKYNKSMQEIALEELDKRKDRYSQDEYQRAKSAIYTQFS